MPYVLDVLRPLVKTISGAGQIYDGISDYSANTCCDERFDKQGRRKHKVQCDRQATRARARIVWKNAYLQFGSLLDPRFKSKFNDKFWTDWLLFEMRQLGDEKVFGVDLEEPTDRDQLIHAVFFLSVSSVICPADKYGIYDSIRSDITYSPLLDNLRLVKKNNEEIERCFVSQFLTKYCSVGNT
uniref:Uncharacterized protein n=1 Tax=Caenorhabditis japonica TaxID=281687 RepID=A0A8R1ENN6_CAEJA